MRDYLLIVGAAVMGVIGYLVAGYIKRWPNVYLASQILCGGVLLVMLMRACKSG